MSSKPRARDLGLPFPGTTGPDNAITDVPDLWVGSTTIRREQVATGVTAIVPRGPDDEMQPVWAGFHALNGNGEMTGTHWIEDAGYFCGPILITNTHAVGIVHHAAVRWMIRRYPSHFTDDHTWAMPIVAETYDGTLSDINGLHVGEADALAALDAAKPGPVAEGNSGGGTGMICYGYKGGTGTSSRVVEVAGRTRNRRRAGAGQPRPPAAVHRARRAGRRASEDGVRRSQGTGIDHCRHRHRPSRAAAPAATDRQAGDHRHRPPR